MGLLNNYAVWDQELQTGPGVTQGVIVIFTLSHDNFLVCPKVQSEIKEHTSDFRLDADENTWAWAETMLTALLSSRQRSWAQWWCASLWAGLCRLSCWNSAVPEILIPWTSGLRLLQERWWARWEILVAADSLGGTYYIVLKDDLKMIDHRI